MFKKVLTVRKEKIRLFFYFFYLVSFDNVNITFELCIHRVSMAWLCNKEYILPWYHVSVVYVRLRPAL